MNRLMIVHLRGHVIAVIDEGEFCNQCNDQDDFRGSRITPLSLTWEKLKGTIVRHPHPPH